ncbi:hypothetical protein HHK36_026989 [Tetracentron sinense]|uniref:Uncharacterized protein n=1 Tax=Tetracentron sinense TaxID=13715 RepID=A0A835D2M4_TETSI|nr:hypothetical protein HHK36_026989 [Tetracentron sinense]
MKRNAEIYTKDRFQLPSSSMRRSNEFGKSKKWSGSRVPRESKDISRVKRVRFADSNTVYPLSYKRDASSKPAKGTNPPRDDPKTSEYAFFKKLKEDAGQNLHSYPLHKQDSQLNKFKAGDSIGDMTNMIKHNSEELRLIFPVEKFTPIKKKFTPIDLKSIISPLGVPENSVYLLIILKFLLAYHIKGIPLFDVQNVQSVSRKLLRYDLVSVLLRRLVPDSDESNICMDPRSRHMDLNTKSPLLSSSDNNFKELPWTPKKNFMAPMHMQYLEGSSFACWPSESRESLLSKWDSKVSESFSTGYAGKVHMQYKRGDHDRVSYGGRLSSLPTKSESTFGIDLGTEFAFENYGSLALDHIPMPSKLILDYENLSSHWHSPQQSLGLSTKLSCEELDEFHDPNEPALGRERCTLLLDWDDTNMQNETKLSIASQNTALSLDSTLPTSWGDDHCSRQDSKFDSSGLCSSSFLAIYHPPLDNLQMTSKLDWSDHENLFSHRHSLQQSLGPSSKLSYKELDELHNPNESSLGRELCTLLLDGDDSNMQSELDLSNSFHNKVLNFDSTFPTSWGDDHCQNLDSKFDASGLCSSSSLTIHDSPVFTSLWDFSSESYHNHAVRRQALDDRNYLVAGLNLFPLSSPCTPNYLALADGCNFSNSYRGSSVFGSPHNHHKYCQVFREKRHPSLDALLLSSGLDYGFGWKGLSIIHSSGECHSSTYPDLQFPAKEIQGISSYQLTGDKSQRCLDSSNHIKTQTHIAQDVPNNNSFSSFSFQISLNKEWVSPLLFDKSSCDGPEGKICFGGNEGEYN